MLPKAEKSWTIFEAAHLLNRAGFGGNPGEIKKFHALGREAAVESLISPDEPLDAFPLPAWSRPEEAVANLRESMRERRMVRRERRDLSPEAAEQAKREARKAMQRH